MDESLIIQYLRKKGVQNPVVAGNLTEKATRYDDIKQELMGWLRTGEFRDDGVEIEGYRAKDIAKLAHFMDGVGVCNFMVDLREKPEVAKKHIADGFPVF